MEKCEKDKKNRKVQEMRIAVLGPEGTFCDKAYLEFKKNRAQVEKQTEDLQVEYFPTIDEVFRAVTDGKEGDEAKKCELGIVPIENTLDGYVQRTLDLLLEEDVWILSENMVEVQFSMIGNASSLEDVRQLYVQFKANGQCRQFINSLKNVKITTTESNMESYYSIRETEGLAAIVPKHIAMEEAAKKDKLVIDNVTDADNNYTRFVIFKRGNIGEFSKETIRQNGVVTEKGKVRMPVYIVPGTDRPGLLFGILQSFYENQINLISIMSRPTKQALGTYNFYLEIDGDYEQLDVILDTLQEIRKENEIKLLGIYPE